MNIIKYIDCHGNSWWASEVCEHCGQDIHKTVDSLTRPWKCVKAASVPGCGRDIQSFDTLDKANAYYNPRPPSLTIYDRSVIITDVSTPTPLPSPPADKPKPPIDYFAINKEFASR